METYYVGKSLESLGVTLVSTPRNWDMEPELAAFCDKVRLPKVELEH